MTGDWQRRRVTFSHDWLKNRYLPALASWTNVLDGKIEDSTLQESFETEVLIQWEARRDDALALIETYATEMSPRRLFDMPPLSRCEEPLKTVAADVLHELWIFRHHVLRLVCLATARVKMTHIAYSSVSAGLRAQEGPRDLSAWKDVRVEFETFSRHCRKLGRVFALFQDEISAV